MREHLLDRSGDAPVPTGYCVVDNEVDFLQHATDGEGLFVRGEGLCNWAGAFFQGRDIAFREVRSPRQELLDAFPQLTTEQAEAILACVGSRLTELKAPLTAKCILQALYPGSLWEGMPSSRHAAEWLVWLHETSPDSCVQPILLQVARGWLEQASNAERSAYSVVRPEEAVNLLDSWLGITEGTLSSLLGEFPLSIPIDLVERAREFWRRAAVISNGRFLAQISNRPMPALIRGLAAEEARLYFKAHSDDLTDDLWQLLRKYLNWSEQIEFQEYRPPEMPADVPNQAEAVLRWFASQYLPYRLWQSRNEVDLALARVSELAQQFARWYLAEYPRALAGHSMRDMLSFARTASLTREHSDSAVLVVVLDGLHAADGDLLRREICRVIPRLTVLENGLCLSPLPTTTEFAKGSLFKGVPPNQAEQVGEVGIVLPEDKTPTQKLRSAKSGSVFLWRLQEPDRTYHRKGDYDSLLIDVDSELKGIVRKMAEIVEQVPSETSLRIVVTTDHGRLLAKSKRTVPIPKGMQAHGRAAWGTQNLHTPTDDYSLESQEVVILNSVRFGLPCEVAVCWGENCFVTNDSKLGIEAYPHGGLYPEEVIIPWIVLARDFARPQLEFRISGKGVTGRPGLLLVEATNLADSSVELIAVKFDFGKSDHQAVSLSGSVGARSRSVQDCELVNWPTADAARSATAKVSVRLSGGMQFDYDVAVEIESDELYHRSDILEDLGL